MLTSSKTRVGIKVFLNGSALKEKKITASFLEFLGKSLRYIAQTFLLQHRLHNHKMLARGPIVLSARHRKRSTIENASSGGNILIGIGGAQRS